MADLYALHWNAVTHANEYTVEVNPGGSGWATLGTTSGTQYTVVNTSTAYQSNIKYRVKAKDTTGVYDDSPYSEELSITYYSITNTLTNCTSDNIQQMVANGFTYNSIITVSDGYIIGSDNWNVTIGGTSDKTKGTLSSDGKTLNVAILSANGNIVITASAALEAPAAPTITLTGSTISWAAVTGATGYRIIATADVAKQTDITSTSFDLSTWSDLTAGTWTVRVLSTNGTVYSDSSNTVTYTIQNKLATPAIAMNADGKTLEITDVENATSYDVYVDGTLKTNVASVPNTTTVDLSTLSDITDGTHTVKVKAKASGYIDSEFSNEVSYTKAAFKQIQLIKILNDTYSAIGAAKTSKIYTIKDLETTDIYKIYYDATNSRWEASYVDASSLNLTVNYDASNASTIVFRGYVYDTSGLSNTYSKYIALEGDNAATASDFNSFTATDDANLVINHVRPCFAENTLISTKSGDKFVQDITYDDDILVWNFDEGKLDYAKPVFIKQEQTSDSYWRVTDEDGKTVNLVGSDGKSHRLYNKRTHLFKYPQDIPECKCEEIHESVKYYNIVTAYHFNCFANGILTSKRYSNMLYPITDEMKYDKTVKHTNTCKREQFNFLTDDEFEKLRLSEMEYSDEMRDEVKHFFTLKVK